MGSRASIFLKKCATSFILWKKGNFCSLVGPNLSNLSAYPVKPKFSILGFAPWDFAQRGEESPSGDWTQTGKIGWKLAGWVKFWVLKFQFSECSFANLGTLGFLQFRFCSVWLDPGSAPLPVKGEDPLGGGGQPLASPDSPPFELNPQGNVRKCQAPPWNWEFNSTSFHA